MPELPEMEAWRRALDPAVSAAIWAGAIGASLAALPVLLSQVPSVTSVEPAPEPS